MQAQITNITKNALFFIKELVGLYFKKNYHTLCTMVVIYYFSQQQQKL